jgi:8-oxo-dGTP pyrophosphatase MutT (NUDIX family)
MTRPWKPSVTVAAIIERGGRFLLVEEETSEGIRINQPAGHLDPGEALVDAAARETLERLPPLQAVRAARRLHVERQHGPAK